MPVRPHIKKFLDYRYPDSPINLDQHTLVGAHLLHLMRRPWSDKVYNNWIKSCTKKWPIEVSHNTMFGKGCRNISPQVIMLFNNFVDSLFKEQLYFFLDNIDLYGISNTKEGILAMMERYGLQEGVDTSYDSLKKAYYRYRNSSARIRY